MDGVAASMQRRGVVLAVVGLKHAGGEHPTRDGVALVEQLVEADDRGYIYIIDRANTGMHVLELTGAARAVANFK